MKLPEDLVSYSRKYITKRIVLFTVLFVAFSLILYFFGNIILPTDVLPFRISFYILVLLVPFAVTGVPFKLIDHSWFGKVIKVDVEEGIEFADGAKARMYGTINFVLTIKKDNGKILYREVKASNHHISRNSLDKSVDIDNEAIRIGSRKNEHFLDDYKVGDKVFHLYGSKYIVVLPKTNDTQCKCAICGTLNKIDNMLCNDCRHTLIK